MIAKPGERTPPPKRHGVARTGRRSLARAARYFSRTSERAIFADSDDPARSSRCTVALVTDVAAAFPLFTTGPLLSDPLFFDTVVPS
jgi:hypothetical protein